MKARFVTLALVLLLCAGAMPQPPNDTRIVAMVDAASASDLRAIDMRPVSKDDYILGVRSVDASGLRNPVTYPLPSRE